MKYILTFESWSPLLKLDKNEDIKLIDKIQNLIPEKSSILEISCGNGRDSIMLYELGYNIIATDITDEYVNHVSKFINCIKHDTRDAFNFNDNTFDLIYSRFGLHYFSIDELTDIFKELHRLTKRYLLFTVKIENDDIKTNKNILSKEKWVEITEKDFTILELNEVNDFAYGVKSKWIEILAIK